MVDRKFASVLCVSFAFLGVFTAFQTMGNMQKAVMNSIHSDDQDYNADGYTSLAIVYAVFAISTWFAPSLISLIGPKFAMLFGGVCYLLFIMNFLIPRAWLLYLVSALVGLGAATIWTGQGNYLTLNSTKATMSRNSGVFWAILQCSLFFGNLFVYIQFKGQDTIERGPRNICIWVLTAVCAIGLAIMVFLPPVKKDDLDSEMVETPQTPVEALVGAFQLFVTPRMLLLCVTFAYTGLELGFWSGVYSSAIGFTEAFPSRKELVGLSGIFIGLGEVIGGATFGILGAKTVRWGRDPIVIGGFIIHVLAFFLVFLNLPNDSVFSDTPQKAFIISNVPLAIFCSFLFGLGDACFNTQVYSLLGSVYADNSASAFAIFKFTQSLAAAASFFYASHVQLYPQLGILLVASILGTITFVIVEWAVKKEAREKRDVPIEGE